MTTLRLPLRLRTLVISLPLATGLLGQVGCGSDGSSAIGDGKHPGTEGAPCDDGGCDDGLECLSNVCVDPQSGSGGTAADTTGSDGSGDNGSGGTSNNSSTDGANDTSSTTSGGGTTSTSATSGGGTGGTSGGSLGGSAGASADGSSTDGMSTDGAAGDTGAVTCERSHPNVNGQVRSCDEGSCYCAGDPVDTCFPADTVEACCDGDVRCGSNSEPPGVDCTGTHPIVTDEARTCEPGNCYCSDGETIDKCLPADVARICCPADIELDCVPAG